MFQGPSNFANSQLPGINISKKNLIQHRQCLYRIVNEHMKGVLSEGLQPHENLGKDIRNIIRKNVSMHRCFEGVLVKAKIYNQRDYHSRIEILLETAVKHLQSADLQSCKKKEA